MSQNGKGSKKRPRLVSQETWDKNYERIFKKEKNGKHNQLKNK
jgi:hypothetical protein